MQALARADRDTFLAIERDVREELQLPPFGRMAALILSAPDAETATLFGRKIAEAAPNGEDITVYGPAPAPIGILRGRFRFRFLITAPKRVDLSAYMTRWVAQLKLPAAVRLSVDIDPYSFL
jgi:primosomal protein N' (replication factor Y)